MSRPFFVAMFVGALASLGPISAGAAPRRVRIDVANGGATGDTIRGPVALRLDGVNRLRYDVRMDRTVTFTAGPDLPFMPALPGANLGKAVPSPAPRSASLERLSARVSVGEAFGRLHEAFVSLETQHQQLVESVEKAASAAQSARDEIEAVVRASDGVLQGAGPAQVVADVRALQEPVSHARAAEWPFPDIARLRREADALAGQLRQLPHRFSADEWAAWYVVPNVAAYGAALERAEEIRTYAQDVDHGSAPANAFAAIQTELTRWVPILRGVEAAGTGFFAIGLTEECAFSFGRTRATTITLQMADRLAPRGTPAVPVEVVTVECTTPLSISTGFGFSAFVDEVEFGFAQATRAGTDAEGNPTTRVTTEFAELKRSSFRASPLLLVNTRVKEWNDTLALHVSGGAVVNTKGEPGTDIEWVAGASVSFKRSLFLTAAFHAARVPRLGGGFEVGDEVPTAVATAPLEKQLKPGLLVALTYKLKP